jgi:hypothetical protein
MKLTYFLKFLILICFTLLSIRVILLKFSTHYHWQTVELPSGVYSLLWFLVKEENLPKTVPSYPSFIAKLS